MSTSSSRRIAELGTIMADETRVRLLCLLLETSATTSELVARLGLVQPRVSAHLATLKNAGLVSVSVVGRQHVYAIKSNAMRKAISAFMDLAFLTSSVWPGRSVKISETGRREVLKDSGIRRARTCYDHLAGVAGVKLLDGIVKRGWVERGKSEDRRTIFNLTKKGRESLKRLNVKLTEPSGSKRMFAYGCLDWTERRYHLGGYLGKAILDSLIAQRIVEKPAQKGSRAVIVRKPFLQWMQG